MKLIVSILIFSFAILGTTQNTDLDKALFEAIEAGDSKQVLTLLEQGASVDASYLRFKPLHMAAIQGQAEITQILLDNGADAYKEITALTPFHMAAKENNIEVLKVYLESGFPIDIQQRASFEQTALNQAILAGSTDAFLFLLQKGANPNIQAGGGWTAIMHAVERDNEIYVTHLVSQGVDLSITNNSAMTALALAKDLGKTDIVNILEAAHTN